LYRFFQQKANQFLMVGVINPTSAIRGLGSD
jgi:hypothetical protein